VLLAEHIGADDTLVVIVLPLVVVGLALIATLRVAGRQERLLIERFGRVSRVRGPGPTWIVPGLERTVRMSVARKSLGPLPVPGWTGDGLRVRALVFAESEVVDPAAAASLEPGRVAMAVEAAITAEVAVTELAELCGATGRINLADAASRRVAATLSGHGVRVPELVVERIELEAGPDLLSWADRRAGRTREG
jgi:regulator of protease activity HflC (stomatin/prohibitin superfamily)